MADKIEAGSLFSSPSFSFLHFPVTMKLALKTFTLTVPGLPDESITSRRNPRCILQLAFGPGSIRMLTYYPEAIDEQ